MPTITYHQPTGEATTIEVEDGATVMRTAVTNGVRGIVGECGGQAMCATCHVYVRGGVQLPERSEDEEEMLDCTATERTDASRLGCQIALGNGLDFIEVDVPASQV